MQSRPLRFAAMAVRNDRLRPRLGLYRDRVAWFTILLTPWFNADWLGVLSAVALWTARGFAAGLGRY